MSITLVKFLLRDTHLFRRETSSGLFCRLVSAPIWRAVMIAISSRILITCNTTRHGAEITTLLITLQTWRKSDAGLKRQKMKKYVLSRRRRQMLITVAKVAASVVMAVIQAVINRVVEKPPPD